MSGLTPLQVADQYIAAYNANDLEALADLIDDDISLIHYNRGFATNGKTETMGLYEVSPTMLLNKQLTDRTAIFESGDRAVIQHRLRATAAVDTPFAPAGEEIDVNLITVLTVKNGRVVKYEDYG